MVGVAPRILLLIAVCVSAEAHAGTLGERERVVVLAAGPADEALADRIRGQVSDLPFDVETARGPADDSDEGRRQAAERIATAPGVGAVVWYAHGKLSVLRVQDGGSALIERSFSGRPPAGAEHDGRTRGAGSADLEAAAVVVRFALREATYGTASADETHPLAAVPPVVTAAAAPAPQPVSVSPRAPWRAATAAALGWQVLDDGLDALDESMIAEATLSIARFEAGAFGTFGAARSLGAPSGAEAELQRQSAGLLAGVLFVDSPRLRIGARVLGGATAFRLSSRLPGEATQTDARVRFFGGAEARAGVVVRVGPVPLELSVGVGLLVVNAAPALYSGSAIAARLSTLEPRAVVGVGFLLR